MGAQVIVSMKCLMESKMIQGVGSLSNKVPCRTSCEHPTLVSSHLPTRFVEINEVGPRYISLSFELHDEILAKCNLVLASIETHTT